MRKWLPNDIIYRINAYDFEAYFVGGCIRDSLIGRDTSDVDITTNMPLTKMRELFKNYKPVIFEDFGSIAFHYENFQIQITQFRQEFEYIDHRHPQRIDFVEDVKLDLLRRDFTMNALLYHPDEGVIDYVGGLQDIERRLIKPVRKPSLLFEEDYLRMLRAVRFSSELGFEIESEAFSFIEQNYFKVSELSWAQLQSEFYKFLVSKKFKDWALKHPFVITEIIPEMKEAFNFDQNNPYHKYSLYEHTVHVIDHLNGLDNRLIALFHDLGKLYTQIQKEDGRFSYPHHSEVSVEIARKYVNDDYIFKMIKLHDLSIPMSYYRIKKLVSEHGLSFMRNLIEFKRADNLAKSDKALYQVEKCNQYDLYLDRIERERPVLKVSDLAISGDELDVKPNQRGKVLRDLLDLVMQDKIENRKEVLKEEVASWDL
ncbi:MAG: CCA tRNA nucleotidyltransferase [Erysipelothrix sp.]|nr:CCA tRNA nucleotidyltransferase [Erysipelothrix sp.]